MSDPPPRTGMSGLYANLLDPSSNSTSSSPSISRAPVVFKQETTSTPTEDPAPKKLNAAALRFQPTLKRPTPQNPKTKGKPARKPITTPAASSAPALADAGATDTTNTGVRPITKTTLEDWTGEDDVNGFYNASNNSNNRRAGRKKRRKNRDTPPPPTNWDDVYDPSRPNSYEEYKDGDEKIREMEDWRERVLPSRRGRREDSDDDSEGEEEEEEEEEKGREGNMKFAPPKKYSFAPPPMQPNASMDENMGAGTTPPPAPPVIVPDDASGEDAYARRLRMSQLGSAGYSSSSTEPTISRAPVLYTESEPTSPPPTEPPADPPSESPPANALLPGQKDFATRLMSKLGWRAGSGLGVSSTGITKPLRVVATKSNRGKIIDKNKHNNAVGKFGKSSEVVVLKGMVDGLEEEDEGVLMQEIGEECNDSYGTVERVHIVWGPRGDEGGDEEGWGSRVFVKFAAELGALRAVNALEGRLFNGNTIEARFFDREKFEAREFD